PPAEHRGRREESCVPPHDDVDLDAAQGAVVEVVAHEGERDEAGGTPVSRTVVRHEKVVVDGLRQVADTDLVVLVARKLPDDVGRLRAVVAADIEEVPDAVLAEDRDEAGDSLPRRLLAGGAEGGRRRVGDELEFVDAFSTEVDEAFLEDAADSVYRAVDGLDLRMAACLEHRSDER